MLPHMTVVIPCDYNQTRLATKAIIERFIESTYLRFGRPVWPIFITFNKPQQDEWVKVEKYTVFTAGKDDWIKNAKLTA